MSDPLELGARELARAVAEREISAREIAEAALARIAQRDGAVGAFLSRTETLARQAAAEVDRRIAGGERLPLAGVPLALKDNLC
ncbi:MAG: amidase family protein, partial [Vulcanimicrobiaceae bacterium]